MSEVIYLLTLGLFFGTILLVFGMKYFSAALGARASQAREDAYRALAAKAVTAQAESAGLLAAMQSELSEIKARLMSVEKILKAVE